jgi:hypothetical protein
LSREYREEDDEEEREEEEEEEEEEEKASCSFLPKESLSTEYRFAPASFCSR